MVGQDNRIEIQEDIPLSANTTIGLGGKARYFTVCDTLERLRESLEYARIRGLRVHVLGGGSNVIFSDDGFDGLVVKMGLVGISFEETGNWLLVRAGAAEGWDEFVNVCINRNGTGLECLSGIPGFVGATPIQNVGAYGQEVKDTIVSLKALDRKTLNLREFEASECQFRYRQSRFKSRDTDAFIITEVTFRLRRFGRPDIRYGELRDYLDSQVDLSALELGRPALTAVRSAVLTLRKRKSMVFDRADPNSRSVGSFFVNPVLSSEEYRSLERRWKRSGGADPIPTFSAPDGTKVPAAWLVEKAGFPRGYRKGGVGISSNHSLALINRGGTTRELLGLAADIERCVYKQFAIRLEREPIVVK